MGVSVYGYVCVYVCVCMIVCVCYLRKQPMGASVWNIQNKDPFVDVTKEPPTVCIPILKVQGLPMC